MVEIIAILSSFLAFSVPSKADETPNIILIMADDMGYECLSSYGSLSYKTPVIDSLASHGIRFTQCVAQPLCTPSRVKVMTGLYNYRNYDYFEHLRSDQYTFGNLMQEAGFKTCIVGKWQLNGRLNPDLFPDWEDPAKPFAFGFDEYCLWQVTARGSRYAKPVIEQNGTLLKTDIDDYGPDIFADYIIDYLDRNKDNSFFLYYPMVLTHAPFVPTPDSEAWKDPSLRNQQDSLYFKDMVEYTDKIIGKIAHKLASLDLDKKTILIFTGDNGTHRSITTTTDHGLIQGGKGTTTDAGTHVPLIIYWPDKIQTGSNYDELIEFSDFFPTLADIVNLKKPSDGHSFLPLLENGNYQRRETAFVYYNPDPMGEGKDKNIGQFARTVDYKLYTTGKFYNLNNDILEKSPLENSQLSKEEKKFKSLLQDELSRHPEFKYYQE